MVSVAKVASSTTNTYMTLCPSTMFNKQQADWEPKRRCTDAGKSVAVGYLESLSRLAAALNEQASSKLVRSSDVRHKLLHPLIDLNLPAVIEIK